MTEFPQITCAFLAELERNNDRTWFADNMARYQTDWLEPAKDFVSALSGQMKALTPPHKAEARVNGSIRRLQRDTRFSRDKTPYDPKLHFIFWTGDHPTRSSGIHIVLHPDRLGLGVGHFAMSATELDRYRFAVSKQTQARQDLVEILERLQTHHCILTSEELKRVPRGYAVSAQHETLLKRKGLVARTTSVAHAPVTICDFTAIKAFCVVAAELNAWLHQWVTQPPRLEPSALA